MSAMSRVECLVYGALGGMCPTIAKLAGFYSTRADPPLPEVGVWIGLGLFAFLGSIIAIGFGANEIKAAIIAGIAAPGIVTNIASGVTAEARQAEMVSSTYLFGLSPAYAQSEDTGAGRVLDLQLYGQNRVIELVPSVEGGMPAHLNLPIEAIVTEGGVQSQVSVGTLSDPSIRNLVLPEGTTALQIGPTQIPLPADDSSLKVTIETAPTWGGDLLWALGGSRTYEVQQIQIAPQQ
jgi:hypothetical protein